ncbi:MAG: hypothetical protein AMJ88_09700 [Anaerolineae bacterium SM23_ 63]|nr:MAG: hypothetical protein AMJ88_09700 [Anaerolineae bacterium SM23_ 63]HEY46149.1 hypothetical protein [Anaerolineae bacterium]
MDAGKTRTLHSLSISSFTSSLWLQVSCDSTHRNTPGLVLILRAVGVLRAAILRKQDGRPIKHRCQRRHLVDDP